MTERTAPQMPGDRPAASTLGKTPRALRVDDGDADIFLLFGPPDSDRPRRHLLSVSPGEWIFDVGLSDPHDEMELLVSPQQGASLHPVEIVASQAAALENWITALLEAILEVGQIESPITRRHDAGEISALAAGEVLGTKQGLAWWPIPPESEAIHLGVQVSAPAILPLLPRIGATLPAPAPASRLLTTAEFLAQPGWPDRLAAIQQHLLEALRQTARRRGQEERQLIGRRRTLNETANAAAWNEIASVIHAPTSDSAVAPTDGSPESSLLTAFHRVASHLGAAFDSSAHPPSGPRVEQIAALARSSSFRWREVLPTGRWFRRNCGPLLGFLESTQEAVALLPAGSRGYEMIRADGSRIRVSTGSASQLEPAMVSIYRTLPNRKLSLRDVVEFTLRGNLPDVSTIFLMVVVTGLVGLATPALSAHIYDVVIPQSERGLMLQITLILLCAALVNTGFELVRAIALIRIENRADNQLEAAIWDRLLKLPSTFFRRFTAGDLAMRAQGISDAHRILSSTGATILFALPVGLFNLIVMFYRSVPLAWWGLGIAVAGALAALGFNLGQLVLVRRQFAIRGRLAGLVFQIITGVGKIRLANAESFAFVTWVRDYVAQEKLVMRAGKWSATSQTFFSGFSIFTTAMLFALVAWKMGAANSQGHVLTTGEFLAFNVAFGALISSLTLAATSSLNLLQLFPLFERIKPIFDEEPEVAGTRGHPGQLAGGIEISDLRFSYGPDTQPVLDGLSLMIEPGTMIAIVGPSGCGKSTLIRLLLGFETPDAGSILYDGRDLQTLNLQEVRRQVGVVLQNTQLIAGDIFRNIVGETGLTIEDAWAAAEMAGLADDIRAMPMQMFTMISEGGGGLSGGQKQRLAIARAFARKPRLLLFDEATSALDNRTQAIVTESMERMQITRIVVAHRLSTILKADRIVMLQGGRVHEEGTYAELMARKGSFHALASRQLA